jgi:acyl dehydratase
MTTVAAPRLPEGLLGTSSAPCEAALDARWLMAYAAGLGETAPAFYDTCADGSPAAHPLFPVCYEWPAIVALREQTIGAALAPLSVHATHDLVIHRPPRAGDRVTTTARVVAVERRRSGTLLIARVASTDAHGRPLTTTDYGSLYRGVDTPETGRLVEPLSAPVASAGAVQWTQDVELAATVAHVYTECARIWNPIHTDVAVARAAGLPAIILHGTATLAVAVSRVVRRELAGDGRRVRGIAARFTGFVQLPSTITVRGRGATPSTLAFDAVGAAGASVLGEGALTL